MHLCFVPITPDNKLSAKAILGNQKSLSEWQTAYHERMSARWNQLERGQSSMETKRKHIPTCLPDAEKFSKEIGKQQAYIDRLKERIGQESDYVGRMRDEKYDQELKVQKANQRIFELQKTNQQMERLLKKIPPGVLEELQKSNKNRSRER